MTTPLLQPDFPTWEEVRTTLTRHITHWAPQGGESALVLLRAEDSVSLQYAGRVVYELFQNALDRASSRVVVRFVDGLLVVGNNGRGVSVDPKFNYGAHNTGARRADFHALCALHTSNKDPDEQFGNKGIGFRSVFGVSDRVQVWSRCKDGWWGMELVERFVPTTWEDSAIPELDSAVRALGTTPRPSFQLPRPLRSSSPPHPAADGLSTVVLLQVDKDQARDQIAAEVHRLAQTRFQFVGSRRPGLQLELIEETRASTHGWGVVAAGTWPELAGLAEKAKHAVKRPTVQVAWAGPDEPRGAGWFYNYLPNHSVRDPRVLSRIPGSSAF